jgi:phosphatidylethanolamine-binding protein (PEBP) family uncharacterized protein
MRLLAFFAIGSRSTSRRDLAVSTPDIRQANHLSRSARHATISPSQGTAALARREGTEPTTNIFRLLALSRPALDLKAPATAADVLKAAQPYVIERTELVGTYHR